MCVWLCTKFPTLLYPFTFTPVLGSSSLKVGNQKLREAGKRTPSLTARRCCSLSVRGGGQTYPDPASFHNWPRAPTQGHGRASSAGLSAFQAQQVCCMIFFTTPKPSSFNLLSSQISRASYEVLVSLQSDKEENLHKVRVCAQRTHGPWDSRTMILMLRYSQCCEGCGLGTPGIPSLRSINVYEGFSCRATVGSDLRAYRTFRSS